MKTPKFPFKINWPLVNWYLLHVPKLPSQPASNVGGLVIHWTGLTKNNLCIISISLGFLRGKHIDWHLLNLQCNASNLLEIESTHAKCGPNNSELLFLGFDLGFYIFRKNIHFHDQITIQLVMSRITLDQILPSFYVGISKCYSVFPKKKCM